MASEAGIPAVICNGTEPGTLAAAAAGERGRHPLRRRSAGKASSFKLWLKYAKPTRGHAASSTTAPRGCCARAAPACCRSGSSAVEGSFEAGDAVEVVDATAQPIGKGIGEYSAARARAGDRAEERQVRELLPHAAEEVIHRDRFVLL